MTEEEFKARERLDSDKLLLASLHQRLDALVHQQSADKLSLAALGKKVVEADAEISELTALKSSLQASICRRSATFTPRSLPTFPLEILGMIFEIATDTYARPFAYDTILPATTMRSLQPFRCAAVCRRWYSAALANRSLWSYICVPNCYDDQQSARWHLRVKQLLERSGTCGLHIEVDLPVRGCDRDYSLILSDLLLNSSRWRYLFISGFEFDDDYLDVLRLLRRPTPLLEDVLFSFSSVSDELHPWPPAHPIYLPYAPNLRTVHLENVPITIAGRGTDLLPATSLAFYEVAYDLSRFRTTVSSFAALETLNLHWEEVDSSTGVHSSIVLLQLRSLFLSRDPDLDPDAQYVSFASILDNIVAPKLRKLQIPPDMLPLAANLLRRAAPTLESLCLRLGMPFEATVVPTISPLTELRDLMFDGCILDAEFFDTLRAVPGGVWPKLQRLALIDTLETNADAFVRFLHARYPIDRVQAMPECALLDLDLSRDELCDSVAAGELGHILETERRRRIDAGAEVHQVMYSY
ncbi:hypothetical protein AURDEDRAFT_122642 [Auricularia subglabra TFB-10046 SS5]|nr:hypothetical protein AURDEDRAFT_122642 [Auricularia subglabra TFB-10046 SS5]